MDDQFRFVTKETGGLCAIRKPQKAVPGIDRFSQFRYTQGKNMHATRLCTATIMVATVPGPRHPQDAHRLCRRSRKPGTVSASAVNRPSGTARMTRLSRPVEEG